MSPPQGYLAAEKRDSLRHGQWLGMAALFILLWQAPPIAVLQGVNIMPLWLHSIAEIFAVVVAMLIFGVGWNNYGKECPGNIVILACAFLAVGLLDLAHLLSYRGMPDFITPSGVEKGINFWLSARYVAAIALCTVAFRSWRPFSDPASRYALLAGALGVSGLVYWLGLYHQAWWPRTFIDGHGLTPLKIGAEYLLVAILLVATVRFYRQVGEHQSHDPGSLFLACTVTILSELSFTLYSDVTDGLNMLGHTYKIIAYYFLYQAIFVSSVRRPFRRAHAELAERKRVEAALRDSYEEISDLYNNAPCGYHSLDKDGVFVRINNTELGWLGYTRDEVIGRLRFKDLLTPDCVSTHLDNFPRFKVSGQVRNLEYRLLRKDGSIFFGLLSATAVRDGDGNFLMSRSTLYDITSLKQAEAALQEREAMLEGFLASSPVGMLMLDKNLRHINVNPALAEMSGVSVEQHLGKTIEEVVPGTAPTATLFYQHVLDSGEALLNLEFASEVPRYPGIQRAWLVSIFPICGADARPFALGGIIMDITERKRMEEQLKSREATLTQAQQIGLMGSWEWHLPSNELIWSDELYRIYGIDPQHTQASRELFFRLVPEEEHVHLRREMEISLQQLTPCEAEYTIIRPDGEQRIMHTRAQVFHDDGGVPQRVVGVEQDITQRRLAERALRENERHKQQLLSNLPVSLVVHGPDSRILYSNASAQEFLGLSEDQMLGKAALDPAWHFVREDGSLMPVDEYPVSKVIADKTPVNGYVIGVVRKSGEAPHWCYVQAFPELDEHGDLVQAVVAFVDINERKNAERALLEAERHVRLLNEALEHRVAQRTRQLEAANKELEAFSYSVSHDLRAPLRSIDGFSQILLRNHAGQLDATGRDYLKRVSRAGKRMGELIDDLLMLSRVSRTEVKREPLDLSRLVCSVGREIKAAAPERQVEWIIPEGISVQADGRLMHAMLENLLNNAWKFTAKTADARIEFGTFEQSGEKVLFIRDNGAGFDMRHVHKLFGAFQRLHRAEDFEGTGIGLATVQRIVNRHGGRIWAEGAVGRGATFYFTISQ